MSLKLLNETDTDDPILSVVNLIDIFLVIIAPLHPAFGPLFPNYLLSQIAHSGI